MLLKFIVFLRAIISSKLASSPIQLEVKEPSFLLPETEEKYRSGRQALEAEYARHLDAERHEIEQLRREAVQLEASRCSGVEREKNRRAADSRRGEAWQRNQDLRFIEQERGRRIESTLPQELRMEEAAILAKNGEMICSARDTYSAGYVERRIVRYRKRFYLVFLRTQARFRPTDRTMVTWGGRRKTVYEATGEYKPTVAEWATGSYAQFTNQELEEIEKS